jgi:hypothetical protein
MKGGMFANVNFYPSLIFAGNAGELQSGVPFWNMHLKVGSRLFPQMKDYGGSGRQWQTHLLRILQYL